MTTKKEKDVLKKIILDAIEKERPKNVDALIEFVFKKSSIFSKSSVIKTIKKLEDEGEISLVEEAVSKKGLRLWIILALTAITNILVFLVSERSILLPLRQVVSYLYCFFIPGYCAVNLFFSKKELDVVQELILSIAMSLAIIPIIGLLLNFAIRSLALPVIMLSLSVLVMLLVIATYLKNG